MKIFKLNILKISFRKKKQLFSTSDLEGDIDVPQGVTIINVSPVKEPDIPVEKGKIVHIKLNKLYANHKLKLYVLKSQYLLNKIKNIVQGHTNIMPDLFFHWRVCFCLRSIVVKL